MQVNVAGLRRNIKNLAHNYSDAQVKVREATSNDPWGPSATIMAEIADLTYNVVAFSEIMQMIWKRLNDHGKNWRHVYKALILLEYLIKTGTEKVAQQCKENIYAIQTLREFVYFEEGKDQGTHVREKAKQLANLLKDDERLKNERIKALKAKERFAQHPSGFGSDGYIDGPTHRDMPPGWQEEPKPVSELEMVRPQTAGEEELQLQLAMAMSREEAEQEEAKRRSDDVRLQLALSQSEQDFKDQTIKPPHPVKKEEQQSHLLDLLDISLGAASISSPPLGAAGGINSDPWGTPARAASQLSDPWSGTSSPPIDPWQPNAAMRTNVSSVPLGAMGATNSNDTWALRTHSPSVASGSSNEGWLQTNGGNSLLNGNAIASASGAAGGPAAVGAGLPVDPWLTKNNVLPMNAAVGVGVGVAPTNSSNVDPWITDSVKPAILPADVVKEDPWAPKADETPLSDDPWKALENAGTKKPSPDLDDFDIITNRNKTADTNNSNSIMNNNNASLLDEMDPLSIVNSTLNTTLNTNAVTKKPLKTPQAFLGENSSLVNLDNLIKPIAPQPQPGAGNAAYNPFSDTVIPPKTNLFQQQQPAVPSINQLKQQQPFTMSLSQDPWAPVNQANMTPQQENDYLKNYDVIEDNFKQSHRQHNHHQQQQQPQQQAKTRRPASLNLQFNSNNLNNFQENYNTNSSESPYYSHSIDKRRLQQQNEQPTAKYDVYNAIRQYEYCDSGFDEQPNTNTTTATRNYNNNTYQSDYHSLVNLNAINRNNNNPYNTYHYDNDNDNDNNIARNINTPPSYYNQYSSIANGHSNSNSNSNRNSLYDSLSSYTTNYSNDLSASLASMPGIKIRPVQQQTTIATVHRSNNADDITAAAAAPPPPPPNYNYFYNPKINSNININSNDSTIATLPAIGKQQQQYNMENNNNMNPNNNNNNNNNNMWIKPDAAAASNPFLS